MSQPRRFNFELLSILRHGIVSSTLLLTIVSSSLMAASLPRPAGLEPDIGFWRRIFTEVDTDQALVHDNRHLGIVYEVVELPTAVSNSRQRRISEDVRNKYRGILKSLAGGKRNGLTSDEARVLSLWPKDVTNDELRQAAGRVRFQQGLAERFYEGLVRSGRWHDYIAASLRQADVPASLAALPHVESSFNPEARSHVGAAGLWQFTRSTGRRFMQIDHVVDERRDPYLSSDAAASLLKYNYSILKSWPLAITAYNHGVAGMRRAVKRMGTDDIEVILRNYDGRSFGFASRNFYVAFLAAVEAEANAEKYFGPVKKDKPRPETLVILADYMSANTLEQAFDVSRETLKAYNPALLSSVWSGTKYVPRGFALRLPDAALNAPPKQLLAAIPGDQRFSEQTPDLRHKVERGDSLSAIAARYQTTVSELMALNDLKSRHKIRAGQVLNLPYRGPANLAAIPENAETYTVRSGDTVGEIARRAGISEGELLALNSVGNRNRIYSGQKLMLRSVAESSPADSVVVAAVDQEPAEIVSPVEKEPAVAASVILSEDEAAVDSVPASDEPVIASVSNSTDRTAEAIEITESADDPVAIGSTMEMIEEIVVPTEGSDEPDLVTAQGTTDPAADGALLADPSDYLVSSDGTIEVQAAETLGHYADWLGVRTQRLRDLNGYSFRQPLVIGQRVRLTLEEVDTEAFTGKRIAYHRELQEAFFSRYRIADTTVHRLRRGESVYVLSLRRYKVPIWLLRQYNPDLDLDRVRPGTELVFPRIEATGRSGPQLSALADAS